MQMTTASTLKNGTTNRPSLSGSGPAEQSKFTPKATSLLLLTTRRAGPRLARTNNEVTRFLDFVRMTITDLNIQTMFPVAMKKHNRRRLKLAPKAIVAIVPNHRRCAFRFVRSNPSARSFNTSTQGNSIFFRLIKITE
jgi:hypothetical protein